MSHVPVHSGRSRAGVTTAGLTVSIVLATPAIAGAATYYVAPAGDDGASGDESAPWQTLQHAAEQVGPGDQVIVREGTYVGFEVRTSGTEAEPIVFSAEPGVLIDREGPSGSDGINVHGAAHIVVEGFTVQNASRAGIRGYECDHVTIRDNVTDQNGIWGILSSFCDNITIEGNETSRSEIEHGIYVGNTCENPTVVDNVVWGNQMNGIHLNGDRHAGGGAGFVSGAHIEGNIVFDNGTGGGSAINGDGLRDSVIVNNLIYDNRAAGMSLYQVDGGGASTGNVVAHNTVVMPEGSRAAIQIRDGSTDNTLVNNLFLHEDESRPAVLVESSSLDGFVADHNAGSGRYAVDDATILTLDEWHEETGQDGSSFEATPEELFVDPEGDDFTLADDSPAAAAGADDIVDVDTDLEGNSRGATDLGAIAYGSDGSSDGGAGDDDGPRAGDPEADPSAGYDEYGDMTAGGCGGEDPGAPDYALGLFLVLGLSGSRRLWRHVVSI